MNKIDAAQYNWFVFMIYITKINQWDYPNAKTSRPDYQ